MITKERIQELKQLEATVYWVDNQNKLITPIVLNSLDFITSNFYLDTWNGYYINCEELFETQKEVYHEAKFGHCEKVVKMPKPPTWEETKIEDFIKSNKTKPDNYKELFAFYLNNELFNLEIYSDENCKYFITISDDKNYYKPLFKMPLTKDNYYKALDKMVELWREEE